MTTSQIDPSARELVCPSRGRRAGDGPVRVQTVSYIDIEWCSCCARVRKAEGRVFVSQPSPGQMIERQHADLLSAWKDCFVMTPKRRIKASEARREIQRAWMLWEEDKNAVMAKMMFFCWLQRNRPFFLTFREKYDPWQTVHSWILEYERQQGTTSRRERKRVKRRALA